MVGEDGAAGLPCRQYKQEAERMSRAAALRPAGCEPGASKNVRIPEHDVRIPGKQYYCGKRIKIEPYNWISNIKEVSLNTWQNQS